MAVRKTLVVCCDGTWNEPEGDGQESITNVLKFVRSLRNFDAGGNPQVTYYLEGVGTGEGWWDKYAGGGCGIGLPDKVLRAYRFLCNNFEPGDRLFLFGFSRGAYTARALAGFIGRVGLLPNRLHCELPKIYGFFHEVAPEDRERDKRRAEVERLLDSLKPEEQERGRGRVRVHMLGVWDTVGALGVPTPLLKGVTNRLLKVGFHNTELSGHIDHAYHAMAIDEHRKPYAVDLWTGALNPGQVVEQVWFAGAHSDVGGGYTDDGRLSDISFEWMMEHATRHGLAFDHSVIQIRPEPTALLHDTYSTPYRALGRLLPDSFEYARRPIGGEGLNQGVHRSVVERWMRDANYRPESVTNYMEGLQRRSAAGEAVLGLRAGERVQAPASAMARVSVQGSEPQVVSMLDYSYRATGAARGGVRLGLNGQLLRPGQHIEVEAGEFGRQPAEVRWLDEQARQIGAAFG